MLSGILSDNCEFGEPYSGESFCSDGSESDDAVVEEKDLGLPFSLRYHVCDELASVQFDSIGQTVEFYRINAHHFWNEHIWVDFF